jgi:hypothetical protein
MKDSIIRVSITLLDVDPAIWRRIEALANITLKGLHDVTQIVMGWADYHLHHFQVGSLRYGAPMPDDVDMQDGRKLKLSTLIDDDERAFDYVYDYGDNWRCVVVLEAIAPAIPGVVLSAPRGGRPARSSRGCRWSLGLWRLPGGHRRTQARASRRTA